MSKFKIEVAKPNTNNWNATCFTEAIEADSEEDAIEIAKEIIDKCFDCTADEYLYRATEIDCMTTEIEFYAINMHTVKRVCELLLSETGRCVIQLIECMTEQVTNTFTSYEELVKTCPALEPLSIEMKNGTVRIGW